MTLKKAKYSISSALIIILLLLTFIVVLNYRVSSEINRINYENHLAEYKAALKLDKIVTKSKSFSEICCPCSEGQSSAEPVSPLRRNY